MKRRLSTILFGVVFIAGLSLLLYPTVSDYWNSFHQSRAIASYVDAVDNTDEQKLDEMRKAAQAYNEKLLSKQDRYEMSDQDKAEYESLSTALQDRIYDRMFAAKNRGLPTPFASDKELIKVLKNYIIFLFP
mgnify:CR=1 FL=1